MDLCLFVPADQRPYFSEKYDTDMRILVTASTYPRWRGDSLPAFVHEYCRELAARGHSVTALVPHAEGAAKRENLEGVEVVRYRYWPTQRGQTAAYTGDTKSGPKSALAAIKILTLGVCQGVQALRLAVTRKVDVINPHWVIPQGTIAVVAGLLTRRPVLTVIHGGDIFTMNGRVMKRVKGWTLRHATKVAVNSSATLAAAKKLHHRDDYQVIPMGLEIPAVAQDAKPRNLAEQTRLLFIGRLHEEKGLHYLFEALALLDDSSVTLEVAGKGPAENELRKLADDLGIADQVKWLGWLDRSEFDDVYGRADIFVGPSITAKSGWVEAFGLVFAESLARGVPVIATKTGGIVDIVQDSVNGFLVDEKDPQAIADAIAQYRSNPSRYEAHRKNARARIEQNFSWDVITKRYEQFLEEAVQSTSR